VSVKPIIPSAYNRIEVRSCPPLTQPVHGEEERVLFPKSLWVADELSTKQLPACPVGLEKSGNTTGKMPVPLRFAEISNNVRTKAMVAFTRKWRKLRRE
jgi:hypothetical protein